MKTSLTSMMIVTELKSLEDYEISEEEEKCESGLM